MSSTNKVRFHPLERLDIIDIDALQDLAHQHVSNEIGGLLGNTTGVISENGTSKDFTNRTISFGDLTFAANKPISTISGGNYAWVGRHDSALADADVLSYNSTHASVSNYYNAQGTYPAAPGEAGYNDSFGIYYPKIYARVYLADGVQDNRRFWSVDDGVEVTQQVVTRREAKVEFLLVRADSTAPVVNSETSSEWSYIAQITSWGYISSIDSHNPGVSFRYLADDMVRLATDDDKLPSNSLYGYRVWENPGIPGAIAILRRAIELNRTVGSLDTSIPASYQVNTDLLERPQYSLDGLAGMTDALSAREVSINMKATITVTVSSPDGVNLAETTSFGSSFVNGEGVVSNFLTGTAADPAEAASTDIGAASACAGLFSDMSYYYDVAGRTGTPQSSAAISDYRRVLFIELDPAYAGWSITGLSITPVTSPSNAHHARYALYGGTYDQSRVISVSYKNESGLNRTAYGFKIVMTHSETITQRADELNSELFPQASGNRSYSFKINLKLTNPAAF